MLFSDTVIHEYRTAICASNYLYYKVANYSFLIFRCIIYVQMLECYVISLCNISKYFTFSQYYIIFSTVPFKKLYSQYALSMFKYFTLLFPALSIKGGQKFLSSVVPVDGCPYQFDIIRFSLFQLKVIIVSYLKNRAFFKIFQSLLRFFLPIVYRL